jgi:uncharacterized protein YciI
MAAEIPDGVMVETVWAAEGTYAADAAERRPQFRHEHLSRIAEMLRAGTLVAAGAFGDMSGSLMLLRVADEATAREIVESDVYFRGGIWSSYRIRPFGSVRVS